jgi:GntR family transcriptional regulator, transcriptional repressor for pyruvate dehydrogenase complex
MTSNQRKNPGDMVRKVPEVRHAARLMRQVCAMIRDGEIRVGDHIPAERELARLIGISQEGVRMGTAYLAIFGVLKVRQEREAVVAMSAEELAGNEVAQNHAREGLDLDCICEIRAVLEGDFAALAAERCSQKLRMRLAEELLELFAAADDPEEYLIHEMAFHRIIALAARNSILYALMTRMIAAIYETFREREVSSLELHDSANRHRTIFRAIRDHRPDEARKAMQDHLRIDARIRWLRHASKETTEWQANLICGNLP